MNVMKKMFTVSEAKNLEKLLNKVEDRDDALYLEELHGFLYGLAITPEPVMFSEWHPEVFGEGGPVFNDEQDAQMSIQCLMSVYNRMMSESNQGTLHFPFNYDKMSDDDFDLIDGWAYGLYLALALRPHIWGMTKEYADKTDEDIPEDLQVVIVACCVITAVALPYERENIYETEPDQQPLTEEEMEDELYDLLPLSVETVQNHGEKLRKEKFPGNINKMSCSDTKVKTGRNELCPCGSGKKYKKCCGIN
ncbi:MAG: hypothetical protein STSR0002_22830 [Smithella sp.]|jgi:uncharacterized protein